MKCFTLFLKFIFSHVGLCFLLIFYAALGALVIKYIEAPREEEAQTNTIDISTTLERQRDQLKQRIKLMAKHFYERTFECNYFWKDGVGDMYASASSFKQYIVYGEGVEPDCWDWTVDKCVPYTCRHICHHANRGGHYEQYDPEKCEDKVGRVTIHKIKDVLDIYHKQVEIAITSFGYCGKVTKKSLKWTFANAMLYTTSILSVIGYGHIYPVSEAGRLVTLLYGVVGIPLFLMFMARVGQGFADLLRCIYATILCYPCSRRRLKSQSRLRVRGNTSSRPLVNEPNATAIVDDLDDEDFEDVASVPFSIIFAIASGYVTAGAYLFRYLEDWTFLQGIYFCFISFTTIGFGDLVPGQNDLESWTGVAKLLGAVAFILLGLAVLGMGIDLLTYQIGKGYKQVGKKVGLLDAATTDLDGDGIDDDLEKFHIHEKYKRYEKTSRDNTNAQQS